MLDQFINRQRPIWTAWIGCLLLLAGCEQLRLPAIDPTGERFFLPQPATTQLQSPADSSCLGTSWFPKPAWQQPAAVKPCAQQPPGTPPSGPTSTRALPPVPRALQSGVSGTLNVTPTRMIAPVNSEVILVAGMCGDDGRYLVHQPIEWTLSQDSVGQIIDYTNRGSYWSHSKKFSADFVVTRTANRSLAITRGTPSVTDDVIQQKGQCWISLTSASEGTSYISAVATEGATWPQRRRSTTIYWVDAQWVFPTPATQTAGRPHPLSTAVTRTRTGAPVAGWIVRYEVVGGAPASVGSNGTGVAEVMTDAEGHADIRLMPTTRSAGTTRVRIQIIRPADPNSDAPRTQLGEGYTSVTWSAPGLTLDATGPSIGSLETAMTYRLNVSNPGDIPAHDVSVRDFLPPNLRFISSIPPAQVFGDRAQWQLGDLSPKATRTIDITVRAAAGGSFRYRFQAKSADGLQADASVDTQISRQTLSLTVIGPQTATVGQRVEFSIEVTNTGDGPLDGVSILDRFPNGLEQADGQASPIQQSLGRFSAGETKRLPLAFIVRQAGQLCHSIEVTAGGGQSASRRVCLNATPAESVAAELRVEQLGPETAQVGQDIQITTRVTNTGSTTATNVRVEVAYDNLFEPLQSSPGWDPTAMAEGRLVWIIDSLPPGRSIQRVVLCRCKAPGIGLGRATVTGEPSIRQSGEGRVRIEPAPASNPVLPPTVPAETRSGSITLKVDEFGDPVQVGQKTSYVITIENDSDRPEKNVVLAIQFPPGLKFTKLSGPVAGRRVSPDGQKVTVNPVLEMRPGERLNPFRVEATGVREGDHTLEVRVSSESNPDGVTATEKTTVFAQ